APPVAAEKWATRPALLRDLRALHLHSWTKDLHRRSVHRSRGVERSVHDDGCHLLGRHLGGESAPRKHGRVHRTWTDRQRLKSRTSKLLGEGFGKTDNPPL